MICNFEEEREFVGGLPIAGSRVMIREISELDVAGFFNIAARPDFEYYCFDHTLGSVVRFVEEAISSQKSLNQGLLRKNFMMAVEDIRSGALVGHVTLDVLDKQPDYFDLAYFTAPWRQCEGIATEASGLLLHHVYNKLNLDKVIATVHPNNNPSRKVLGKLGFVETGEVTEVESSNGQNERLLLELDRANFYKRSGGTPWEAMEIRKVAR